jgi:hypothetical protein
MPISIKAFSNCDDVYLAWRTGLMSDCLGFHPPTGQRQAASGALEPSGLRGRPSP